MKLSITHDQEFRKICEGLIEDGRAGRIIPDAGMWLLDNYPLLHAQARQLREALSPPFWAKLAGGPERPRIWTFAAELIERENGEISLETLREFFEEVQRHQPLSLAELWAIQPIVSLALLDFLRAAIAGRSLEDGSTEESVRSAITSLRTLDQMNLKDLVESISVVEQVLRTDPVHVYSCMDFETRDQYRQAVEKLARREKSPRARAAREIEVARDAVAKAATAQRHVGFYLIGKEEQELPRSRYPHVLYFGGLGIITGTLLWIAWAYLAPMPRWMLALLVFPVSQVALAILHPLVNRLVPPVRLPRMDFSRGVPDDSKTFVVIPTLLLSRDGVCNVLERIEIHYLANRDRNLLFGLLTDFGDASKPRADTDDLAQECAVGIRILNERYRSHEREPFYLFHRDREWNPQEGVWMGRERKRGKLDDFNDFLLGRGDGFALKVGDLEQTRGVKYVITLDTDTQLPRDAARELIGTIAHPLHRPVCDKTGVVREGYGLLQPRVSISIESAQRSRLANLYSGQTGLDPYTKAVSDVYQDLFGQASYTGKGIYDLETFGRVTRGRFPDNTLLSHDLIEGEHVRVGLATDIEVIDDFPKTYEAFSKRKHRWVRGDWQIAAWLLPVVPDAGWHWKRNPLSVLSRWKIFDNLRRSLYEITLALFFIAALFGPVPLRATAVLAAVLLFPAVAQAFFSLVQWPPLRFWRMFLREVASQFARGVADAFVQLTFLLHQALLMTDAIVRTLFRRLVTRRKLLEWESAAQAEAGGRKMSLVAIYLVLTPVVATLVSFFAARANAGFDLAPVLIVTLWAASPLAAEFISHKMRFESRHEATDVQFLREISLKTWRYFMDFGGPEDHWLVPDNVQEDPWIVAHRASPTNIGLQLVANVAARDFGYLTVAEMAERLERIFETLDSMERARGHFFNWYDTRTLQPIAPRYVSSVDSGNLAACLITVKQGCADALHAPGIGGQELQSLRNHCDVLRRTLARATRTSPVCRQIEALCQELQRKPETKSDWEALLTDLRGIAATLADTVRGRESSAETVYWTEALTARIDAMSAHLHQAAPDLIPRLQRLQDRADRFFHEMDFRFLLNRERMLMRIGWNAETGRADDSHYDLLASEARTAVFLAVAKGDFPREAWFRLGRRLCSYRGYRTLVSWSGTMFEYLMPALFLRTFEDSLLGESLRGAVRIQQLYGRFKRVPWGISEAAHSARDAARTYQYRAFGVPVLAMKRIEARELVVAPYATLMALAVDPRRATANLRAMAERGWLGEFGFFESVDYTGRDAVVVRAFMAHHQGMAFMGLANGLFGNVMPKRFHSEPAVLATELLLQERLPVIYEQPGSEDNLAVFNPELAAERTGVVIGSSSK